MRLERPIIQLLKGMRQKVGIAMAIARVRRCSCSMNTTWSLDPKASSEFSELVASLRDEGVAVLMATRQSFVLAGPQAASVS